MAKYKTYANPDPNGRPLIDCEKCGEQKEHQAKGLCYKCYKKQWKAPLKTCKECGRKRPHHAFGLCASCHMRLHHYDAVKKYNAKKYHNLALEDLKKATKECVCCGFSKIVELHHLDGDKKNNNSNNLIGLCPNCHRMIHTFEYYEEIKTELKEKGYEVSKVHPSSYVKARDEHACKHR